MKWEETVLEKLPGVEITLNVLEILLGNQATLSECANKLKAWGDSIAQAQAKVAYNQGLADGEAIDKQMAYEAGLEQGRKEKSPPIWQTCCEQMPTSVISLERRNGGFRA